ncbi:hypothetical protein EVB41_011 [Rhizobium phage RHph_TM3_14A]|nr:hypothetical protein EVB29_011 [Rhizobium phage RHph_TM27A]QIG66931.1 hypothetical protein EVB30_011 [Rhizobium phage RHph_TM27B]QIG67021.1 hypothetical protein EVB31_011 [Rhizobium phage RHph_TM29]QIG67476.1 hypothetical protein EVB41_011 [Rhizobium phage RHph_TM3_14A]
MQTIQDFINAARFQLQDRSAGAYRYEDADLVQGLENAFDEAYRIRPDIFVKADQPSLVGQPLNTVVPCPRGYQMAFLFYMCGYVSLSDQEDTQDARAGVFLNKFVSQLTVTVA